MQNPLFEAAQGRPLFSPSAAAKMEAAKAAARGYSTYNRLPQQEEEDQWKDPYDQFYEDAGIPKQVAQQKSVAQPAQQPQAPEQPQSALGKIGGAALNTISAVGNLLDLPGSSVRDVMSGKNPFDQWLDPFGRQAETNRVSGTQMLRKAGLAQERDTWGNFGAGLALELVTDPTTYLGIGALTRMGKVMQSIGVKDLRKLAKEMAEAGGKSPTWVGGKSAGFTATPKMILKHADNMGEKIVKNVDNVVDGKLVKPVEGTTFKSVDDLPESAIEKAEWAMVDDGKSLKAYKSTEGSGKWELDAEGTRAANQQLDQTALGMTPRKLNQDINNAHKTIYGKDIDPADMDKPLKSLLSVKIPFAANHLYEKMATDNPQKSWDNWMAKQADVAPGNTLDPNVAKAEAAQQGATQQAAKDAATIAAEETAAAQEAAQRSKVAPKDARDLLKTIGKTEGEVDAIADEQLGVELGRYGLIDEAGNVAKSKIGENATRVMHQAAGVFGPKAVAAFKVVESMANTWAKLNGKKADEYFAQLTVKHGDEAGTWGKHEVPAPMLATTAENTKKIMRTGERIITGMKQTNIAAFMHEIGHDARAMFDSKMHEQMNKGVSELLGVDKKMFKTDGTWTTEAEEAFANAFEHYTRTGDTSIKSLKDIFAKLKEWMLNVYSTIKGEPKLQPYINDQLKETFETMLGKKPPAKGKGASVVPPVAPVGGSAIDNVAGAANDTPVAQAPVSQAPTVPPGMLDESSESSAAEIERRLKEAGTKPSQIDESGGDLAKDATTPKYPGVTPEAAAMLEKLDQGSGAPSQFTRNLEKIAAENGIEITGSMTPKNVMEKLREKATQRVDDVTPNTALEQVADTVRAPQAETPTAKPNVSDAPAGQEDISGQVADPLVAKFSQDPAGPHFAPLKTAINFEAIKEAAASELGVSPSNVLVKNRPVEGGLEYYTELKASAKPKTQVPKPQENPLVQAAAASDTPVAKAPASQAANPKADAAGVTKSGSDNSAKSPEELLTKWIRMNKRGRGYIGTFGEVQKLSGEEMDRLQRAMEKDPRFIRDKDGGYYPTEEAIASVSKIDEDRLANEVVKTLDSVQSGSAIQTYIKGSDGPNAAVDPKLAAEGFAETRNARLPTGHQSRFTARKVNDEKWEVIKEDVTTKQPTPPTASNPIQDQARRAVATPAEVPVRNPLQELVKPAPVVQEAPRANPLLQEQIPKQEAPVAAKRPEWEFDPEDQSHSLGNQFQIQKDKNGVYNLLKDGIATGKRGSVEDLKRHAEAGYVDNRRPVSSMFTETKSQPRGATEDATRVKNQGEFEAAKKVEPIFGGPVGQMSKDKWEAVNQIGKDAIEIGDGDIEAMRALAKENASKAAGHELTDAEVDDVLAWLSRTDDRFAKQRERIDPKFLIEKDTAELRQAVADNVNQVAKELSGRTRNLNQDQIDPIVRAVVDTRNSGDPEALKSVIQDQLGLVGLKVSDAKASEMADMYMKEFDPVAKKQVGRPKVDRGPYQGKGRVDAMQNAPELPDATKELDDTGRLALYDRMNFYKKQASEATGEAGREAAQGLADEARNVLVEDAMKKAGYAARSLANGAADFDEKQGQAFIKLIEMVENNKYDQVIKDADGNKLLNVNVHQGNIRRGLIDQMRKDAKEAGKGKQKTQAMNAAVREAVGDEAADAWEAYQDRPTGKTGKKISVEKFAKKYADEIGATPEEVMGMLKNSRKMIKDLGGEAVMDAGDDAADIARRGASALEDPKFWATQSPELKQAYDMVQSGKMQKEVARFLKTSPALLKEKLLKIYDDAKAFSEENYLPGDPMSHNKKAPKQAAATVLSHKIAGAKWGEILDSIKSDNVRESFVRALDIGENLFMSNPATRTFFRYFDKSVYGARDYEGQEIARKRYTAYERAIFRFREDLAPIVAYVGKTGMFDEQALVIKNVKSGMEKEAARKAAIDTLNERNNDIVKFFEQKKPHKLNKDLFGLPQEELDQFEAWLGSVKGMFPEQLKDEISAGLAGKDLADIIDYFPRYKADADRGIKRKNTRGEAMLSTTQESQKARDNALRNIPEGTPILNKLSIDKNISGIRWDEPVIGNAPSRETLDKAVAYLDENYARDLLEDDMFDGDEMTKEGKQKLEDIARIMVSLPKEHVEKQVPMFGRNFMHSIARYAEQSHARQAIALSGQELAIKNISTGDTEHLVSKLFSGVGMDRHGAYMNVIGQTDRMDQYKNFVDDKINEMLEGEKLLQGEDGKFVLGEQELTRAELEEKSNWARAYLDKNEVSVNQDAYEAATAFLKPWSSPEEIGALRAAANASLNLFKSMVTLPFPAFHARNFVSGQMQNFFFGAYDPGVTNLLDPRRYLRPISQAWQMRNGEPIKGIATQLPKHLVAEELEQAKALIAKKMNVHPESVSIPAAQADAIVTDWIRRQIFKYGITGDKQGYAAEKIGDSVSSLTSQYTGVQQKTSKNLWGLIPPNDPSVKLRQKMNPLAVEGAAFPTFKKSEGAARPSLGLDQVDETTFWPVAAGQEASLMIEDLNRAAPFIAFLKQGLSPEEAARRVQKIQFDYSDLSETEKRIKEWVPFYNFASKATKLTFGDLIFNPGGKQAWTIRATNRAQDPQAPIPEHIRRGVAIPLGQGKDGQDRYLSGFGLAFEDPLEMASFIHGDVKGTAASVLSKVRPGVQALAETATGRSLFFDREHGDMDPQVGRLRDNILGVDQKGLADPILSSPGVEFLVGKTPAARVVSTANKLLDARKNPLERLLNVASGVKVTDVNAEAADRIRINQAAEELKQLGGRTIESNYVPEWRKGRMSESELQRAEALQKLINGVKSDARNRKKEAQAESLRAAASSGGVG